MIKIKVLMMQSKDTEATYSSAVKHLPSVCEALGSIPEPEKGWRWGYNQKFGKHFKPWKYPVFIKDTSGPANGSGNRKATLETIEH